MARVCALLLRWFKDSALSAPVGGFSLLSLGCRYWREQNTWLCHSQLLGLLSHPASPFLHTFLPHSKGLYGHSSYLTLWLCPSHFQSAATIIDLAGLSSVPGERGATRNPPRHNPGGHPAARTILRYGREVRGGCEQQLLLLHQTCDLSVEKQKLGNDGTYQVLRYLSPSLAVKLDDILTQAARVALRAVLEAVSFLL